MSQRVTIIKQTGRFYHLLLVLCTLFHFEGSKIDADFDKGWLGENQIEAAQDEVRKTNEDASVPNVGDTRQSASGRRFVYK